MEDVNDVVVSRLKLLDEYVSELCEYRAEATSFKIYESNKRLRRAVERCLQVAVEICLDIGRHLISLEGFRYPDNNQDVFQVLAEEEVVPEDLLSTLVDMARFRNLMVHDYARIDDAKVYTILKQRLSDFDTFARAISTYVER